jgi:hypothetical protein
MVGFDFLTNPFWLLRVSPREGRDTLATAVDETISEGRLPESDALSAQRTLMASKPRLDAEVSWFPGVAPSTASRILASLDEADAFSEEWTALPPLVRANIVAHRAGRHHVAAIRELVEVQASIDPDTVVAEVNGDRSVAAFPLVDRALVDQALASLRSAQVSAAVGAIMASPDPPATAAGICNGFVANSDHSRDFVEALVERYDAAATSRMAAVEHTVHTAIRRYVETGDQSDLGGVREAMKAWRKETEARRLVFSAKKLDEPRSAELFRTVRELGKNLVNQRGLPERAQTLFGTLRAAFVDLPSAADQMDRDVAEIAGIVMEKRFETVARDLGEALAEARTDLKKAALSITLDGFRLGANGIAGRLFAGFAKAAVGLAGTEHASLPWTAIRLLAVEITSTAELPTASRSIVTALTRYTGATAPPDVAAQLADDLRALDRIELSERLTAAMGRRHLGDALRIMARLEPITKDKEELASLRQLKLRIEQTRRTRRANAIGWTIAAGIVIGLIVLNDDNSRAPTTERTNVPQREERRFDAQPSAAPLDNSADVSVPPASKDRVLSIEELRLSARREIERAMADAAAAANPEPPRLLDLRSREDVSAIQGQLYRLGFYDRVPDGAWGMRSRAALMRFKQANGLAANDAWDAATQHELFSRSR